MNSPTTSQVSSTKSGVKPTTPAQHAGAAAHEAAERLQLPDEKWVLAALADVASAELARSPGFALRVRSRYDELAPKRKTPAVRGKKTAKQHEWPELVPIKQIPGYLLDASRPLDPFFILEYFGASQLSTALERQTLDNLKEAVAIVKERYPGARIKGSLSKPKAIAFILEHVHFSAEER